MGVRTLFGAAAAAIAVLFTTTGAAAATDLSTLLAGPPGADWIDVGAAPDHLVGAFTAHSYAAWLRAGGARPGETEFVLNLYGFTRGYGLEWEQRGSQDLLRERAFEFRDGYGARSWYNLLKRIDQTAPEYTHDIPLPLSIPDGIASAFKWADATLEVTVNFWKGNVVYVVDMFSNTNDLSTTALAQAASMHATAPSQTEVPPGAGQLVNDPVRNVEIGSVVVVVVLAVTTALAILLNRRSRPRAAFSVGVTMSPDGAYWWDGAQWRDASREAPAAAPRSPDGAYWWDGRAWRLLQAPRSIG